ncbi:MAG: hypothetical protein ABL952_02855 [Pyrinomonadaceae bacterium]
MRGVYASFMIVTGYLIVGSLLMLASGQIGNLLKRLGTKPVTYTRISIFTFGCCVAVLGAFGVSLHIIAISRAAFDLY